MSRSLFEALYSYFRRNGSRDDRYKWITTISEIKWTIALPFRYGQSCDDGKEIISENVLHVQRFCFAYLTCSFFFIFLSIRSRGCDFVQKPTNINLIKTRDKTCMYTVERLIFIQSNFVTQRSCRGFAKSLGQLFQSSAELTSTYSFYWVRSFPRRLRAPWKLFELIFSKRFVRWTTRLLTF